MQLKTLIFMVIMLAWVGYSAACPNNVVACCEVTASGYYYLSGDIAGVDPANYCIQIQTSDVALNGQGYALKAKGKQDDDYIGISIQGVGNLNIRDINVSNFTLVGWNNPVFSSFAINVNFTNMDIYDNMSSEVSGGGADIAACQRYYGCITTWSNNYTYMKNINCTQTNRCGKGLMLNEPLVSTDQNENMTLLNINVNNVNTSGIYIFKTTHVFLQDITLSYMNNTALAFEKSDNISINRVNISYITDKIAIGGKGDFWNGLIAGLGFNRSNATVNQLRITNFDAGQKAIYLTNNSQVRIENSSMTMQASALNASVNVSDGSILNLTNFTYACSICFDAARPRSIWGDFANITIKQPAVVYVTDASPAPIAGATVNLSSNSSEGTPLIPLSMGATDAFGYSTWSNVITLRMNRTSAYWYDNHTINVTKAGYLANDSYSANLSNGTTITTIYLSASGGGVAVCAGTAIHACQHLAAGTAYYLDADMTNDNTGTCFTTDGAGVTFDGCGHTLDGIGIGQNAFYDVFGTFTVKNLILTDWQQGVYQNADLLNAVNITGNNVTNPFYIITLVYTGAYINNVTFTNAEAGVNFSSGSKGTNIVIANSTFNASYQSIILREMNTTLYNITVNASIYHASGNNANITYYLITHSDYSLISVAPNVTSAINYLDIENTSGMLIRPYNHDTLARINNVNFSTSDGVVVNYYDRYWLMQDYDWGSNITVTVSENTGYYPSYVVESASWEDGYDDQLLLIPKTASNLASVTFHVVSSSNTPIAGATCGFFKAGISDYLLVSAKKTDSTGLVGFVMQTTTNYKLTCEATGYSAYTTTLTPISSDYTITLGSSSSGVGFPTSIEGIRTTWNSSYVIWNAVQTLNFSIYNTSANSSLVSFGWNIYNGTTLLNTQTDNTHPSGGSLTYTFIPGNNSVITVQILFQRTGRDAVSYTFPVPTYYGYSSSGGASLTNALSSLSSLGSLTIVFLTLIVGAIVGGYASQISAGAGVVAFMGILTMGFLISSTIMSGALLLMAFVVAGGYFILRGGG